MDFLTPAVHAPTIGDMPGLQRLSGLDASFLYLETAVQPLHVCSILELDTSTMPGGYTFDRLRDGLALRIKAMPEFREKVADNRFNLDHPVWVEDKDFNVSQAAIKAIPRFENKGSVQFLIIALKKSERKPGKMDQNHTKALNAALYGLTGRSMVNFQEWNRWWGSMATRSSF